MSDKVAIRRAGRVTKLPSFAKRVGSNGRKSRAGIAKPKRRFSGRH